MIPMQLDHHLIFGKDDTGRFMLADFGAKGGAIIAGQELATPELTPYERARIEQRDRKRFGLHVVNSQN